MLPWGHCLVQLSFVPAVHYRRTKYSYDEADTTVQTYRHSRDLLQMQNYVPLRISSSSLRPSALEHYVVRRCPFSVALLYCVLSRVDIRACLCKMYYKYETDLRPFWQESSTLLFTKVIFDPSLYESN